MVMGFSNGRPVGPLLLKDVRLHHGLYPWLLCGRPLGPLAALVVLHQAPMAIGVKFAGFDGWVGWFMRLECGGLTQDMAPLRGSNTGPAFTPGLRPGLLMCRPAGAHFWMRMVGFAGWKRLNSSFV